MEKLEYIKGPSFYKEEDRDIFWGRDEEIQELYYLVSNSDFSMCYARSGEGKSSILNAGVIPILRERNFLPVCVRFTPDNYKERNPDFDSYVGKLLDDARNAANALDYKSIDINGITNEDTEPLHDTLWWRLRVNEIRKDAFVSLTPVLIFDQFEEVFTCSENTEWVSKFFAWLESLYSDMNPLDDANIGRLPKNFKVLLSLRSEYVCELDYWSMQRYFIPSLKNNRYYLKALTGKNAREIVNEILSKAKIDNITEQDILHFSQNDDMEKSYEDKPCKSALKLSLILDTCYRYNDKVKDLIAKGDSTLSDILEIYYDEATNELSRAQRDKLEDLLVDSNGRRTKVSIGEISTKIGISENQIESLKAKRIVTSTSANDIEIAHDCMCEIVSKHSAERRKILEQERIQALKNKWFVIVFIFLSICGAALFFSFRTWIYPEIRSHAVSLHSISGAFSYALKNDWHLIMSCLLPYLLPLTTIGVYCRVKKRVKEHIKTTDTLSMVTGTLSVIAACFLYDTIFCQEIAMPTISDSVWWAAVPLLLYLSCILHLWSRLNISIKPAICTLGVVSLLPAIEIFNVCFSIYVIIGLLLVAVGALVASFKNLPKKECAFYAGLNTLALIVCLFAHLGFNPLKINCSEVENYSQPWNYTIIKKAQKYGVVDAVTGDTITPCMFDGFAQDGSLVMLLSPKCEELSDSLIGATNTDTIIKKLNGTGYCAQLNGKNGVRCEHRIDKKLYDISKAGTTYKGKAAKAYLDVRNDLYKAIKQNTPIGKIDTTALAALYRMESDTISALRKSLKENGDSMKKAPNDQQTELILTHSSRRIAVATILDLIHDNRSKFSLLYALHTYMASYFSKEIKELLTLQADVSFNFNSDFIMAGALISDSTTTNIDHLQLNAHFSNKDTTMLGTFSLWQYVYVTTTCLATFSSVPYYKKHLKNFANEFSRSQTLIQNLLQSIRLPYTNYDLNKMVDDYKKGKDLFSSIDEVFSRKKSKRIALVDSLIATNNYFKEYSPYSFSVGDNLKKTIETSTDNIILFKELYKVCSNEKDYHYAIFRQNLIDNLHLASMCGVNIIAGTKDLESQDTTFFNATYQRLRTAKELVEYINSSAEKHREEALNPAREVFEKNSGLLPSPNQSAQQKRRSRKKKQQ